MMHGQKNIKNFWTVYPFNIHVNKSVCKGMNTAGVIYPIKTKRTYLGNDLQIRSATDSRNVNILISKIKSTEIYEGWKTAIKGK